MIKLIKSILVIDQDLRFSWSELISQKIFYTNQERLPDEFRVVVDIRGTEKKNTQKLPHQT